MKQGLSSRDYVSAYLKSKRKVECPVNRSAQVGLVVYSLISFRVPKRCAVAQVSGSFGASARNACVTVTAKVKPHDGEGGNADRSRVLRGPLFGA